MSNKRSREMILVAAVITTACLMSPPARGQSPGGAHLGDIDVPAIKVVEFEVALSDAAWADASGQPIPRGYLRWAQYVRSQSGHQEPPISSPPRDGQLTENPKVATVKVALAGPERFDPNKSWPLLVVNATMNASNIGGLGAYYEAATAGGWVVLAVDGSVPPRDDSNAWRWALLASALDHLHAHWPSSKKWPVACAGFSGGAKRSGYLAAILAKADYRVVGMWMGGCNEDMATEGLAVYQPDRNRFLEVPIFLSSGTSDTVATPQHHQHVMESMQKTGFKKIRLRSYEGGHGIFSDHIKEALAWFVEQTSQ